VIRGFFSPTQLGVVNPAYTAVPLVDAFLWLPLTDGSLTLQFLVDTGADMTVLHPQDSLRLLRTNAQWSRIRRLGGVPLGGAGQNVLHYPVDASLVFEREDGEPERVDLTLHIAEPGPQNRQLESLLGRDVLRHFMTTFEGLKRLMMRRIESDASPR
jgi:hypothetical protein